MAKKLKTMLGSDGYEYPITSYELVLDENGESLKKKLENIGIDNIDLTGYAKTEDIPTKISDLENDSDFLTSIPSEYITETELDAKGYSTFSGSYNDLTNTPTIPTVTNDLTNELKTNYDTAYTHSQSTHAPSNAQANADITKVEIEAKLTGDISTHTHSQYLTEHQSLDEYAKTTDIPTVPTNVSAFTNDAGYITSSSIPTSLPANGGNADTIDNFHIWSGTQDELDAITTRDANTIYLVIEDNSDTSVLQITSIDEGGTYSSDWTISYTTNKTVTTHYYSTWYSTDDATSWMDRTAQVTDNGSNNYTMSFTYSEFATGTKSPAIKVMDSEGNTAIATFTLIIA